MYDLSQNKAIKIKLVFYIWVSVGFKLSFVTEHYAFSYLLEHSFS